DRALEVFGRRRQRAENVLVAAAVDLIGSAAPLNHRHLVLFCYRRGGDDGIASERAKQEVDLVLREQLHVLAHSEVVVRLIVEELESELRAGVANLDAAKLVDLSDGEF